jgi:hypothetical protein
MRIKKLKIHVVRIFSNVKSALQYFFTVQRFPNFSLPKSEWTTTLEVNCGWGKQWDPPSVLGCIDPRGCQAPPPRTSLIYGSFEDSLTKPLDVGTTYWYSCR